MYFIWLSIVVSNLISIPEFKQKYIEKLGGDSGLKVENLRMFCLGKELKEIIASDLNIKFDQFGRNLKTGCYEIVEALRCLVRDEDGRSRDINSHRTAAVKVSQAMSLTGSIDDYVDRHRNEPIIAQCAKIAIAKAILWAEKESKLYIGSPSERQAKIQGASQSWLAYMLRDLTRGLTADSLENAFENLFIINFNYDRCVEHFINLWLQQVYDIEESQSSKITKSIFIHHPYGKLGDLPFEAPSHSIPFGGEVSAQQLIQIMGGIKTYSEAVEVGSGLNNARTALADADQVVFLGFGFHEQNIRLLDINSHAKRDRFQCYATTLGISNPKIEIYKQNLSKYLGLTRQENLSFYGKSGGCEEFWDEYGEVLVQ